MDMQSGLFSPDVDRLAPVRAIQTIVLGGKRVNVSPVFATYWRFAAERQAIFFRRLRGTYPATSDPIMNKFKFTNAYRVLDRTSQYLIREVIYQGSQSPTEVFFRTLLFKLFNKIQTWELLKAHLPEISFESYRSELYDRILTSALEKGERIYSAAYIMPSGGPHGESRKHRSHFRLLEKMMADRVPEKISEMITMQAGFTLLRSYPMIGDFLAYQFITDLNYSDVCHFSEMEFVIPGPGSLDGLKKCFPNMTLSEAPNLIRGVCEGQSRLQHEAGVECVDLWGRPLQLIDCQNLFCEVDKYARIAHPDIIGISGRTRIKQAFRMTGPIPQPFFPPKWKLNAHLSSNEHLAESLS